MIEKDIYEKIKKADIITIFGHVQPDGDCYGSQVGLKEAIKATFPGKKVYILGSGFPRLLSRYGAMDIIDDKVIGESLALIVDVANHERIEDQRFSLAKDKIKIDHHLFSNEYASIEWIDNDAASCSEILTGFIQKMDMKITPIGAEALLLGLVTDSGRFQYASTTANSFKTAAFLVEKGANLKEMFACLYVVEAKDLRFKAFAYENFVLDDGVVYLVISNENCLKYGVSPDYAASQVNLLAGIKGYPIWATFAERENKEVRVELRSATIGVQPVAVKFGGGGHLLAAGCRLDALDQYKDVIIELKKAIKEN